jgi:TetR/AcrR family acrAB operon transcriptional repressor
MVRKTKEAAQETRAAILDAAAKVFVEKGVAKASLEEIAECAGVTRGAVYWHFKNKVDIFKALDENLHEPLIETVLQDMKKDHPEPLKQLENLCVSMVQDLAENENKQRILKIFFIRCDYSGDMEEVLNYQCSRKQEKIELFERYFVKAQAKGQLPASVDPKALTMALSCYLMGIAFEHLRNPDGLNLKKIGPQLIHQFFAGVAGKSA